MKRRRLLRWIGTAAAVGTAGCSGTGGDGGTDSPGTSPTTDRARTPTETPPGTPKSPTGTDTGTPDRTSRTTTTETPGETTGTPTDPSVRIEHRIGAGGFNRPRTLVVTDDGRIRLTVDCARGERTVSGRLPADERSALERSARAVVRTDLKDSYGPDPNPEDDVGVAVTDVPTETLTVAVGDRETTVTYRTRRNTPEVLNRLAARLDRYAERFDRPICGSDPSIRVSMTVSGGLTPTPWHHTVTVTDDGTLEFVHVCKTSDHRETGRQRLSESEHARVERLVRQLDVASLADQYTCGETCPTDLPGTTLTIHVGDRNKEIYFYQPDREDVPERLRTLLGLLSSYGERFEYDCPEQTGTPSGDGAGG